MKHKIVLVVSTTRLQELITRFNTIDQARFYIEHMGIDFNDYIKEDEIYQSVVNQAKEIIQDKGRVQVLYKEHVSNYSFDNDDLVIVIGRDGLVVNTLKYLDGNKVIAINPDPERWTGILLPFRINELSYFVDQALKNNVELKEISLAKAQLNDGQVIYGVNDLYIGQRTHVSSRYKIKCKNQQENQSSSGIIVSTGLGSTGWLSSVIDGANGITSLLNGTKSNTFRLDMPWNAAYLYFSVREPFKSASSNNEMVIGKFDNDNPLVIQSHMPSNGCIFSDGVEDDYLDFNSGSEVTITLADKKGILVVG